MTNDTSTLNGALTELGELMADNLNSMGVSDADASDGLTTLANKILDIAPVSQNLTLTSDKSVLSAYDSEYATLTATLSGGVVEGQTVSFDIVDSGTVVENIGTATTNSSGVATVSYYAEGTGDLNIQASVGMIVSETYSLEDCTYYNTNTYSRNDVTFNIALPNHFIMSYDFNTNRRSGGSSPYILIGNDTTHKLLVGQYAQSGANGIGVYNGSSTGTFTNMGTSPLNTWFTFTFTYDGEKYHLTDGTLELSMNKVSTISLSKLLQAIGGGGGGELKNIKIKPL